MKKSMNINSQYEWIFSVIWSGKMKFVDKFISRTFSAPCDIVCCTHHTSPGNWPTCLGHQADSWPSITWLIKLVSCLKKCSGYDKQRRKLLKTISSSSRFICKFHNFIVWLLHTHKVSSVCLIQLWICPFIQAPEELEWDQDERVEPTKLQPKNTKDGAQTDGIELEHVTLGKKHQSFRAVISCKDNRLSVAPALPQGFVNQSKLRIWRLVICGTIRQMSLKSHKWNFKVFCIVVLGIFNATFSRKPHEKLVNSRNTSWCWRFPKQKKQKTNKKKTKKKTNKQTKKRRRKIFPFHS